MTKLLNIQKHFIHLAQTILTLPKKDRLVRMKNIKYKHKECPKCTCIQPTKYILNTRGVDTIDAEYEKRTKHIYPEYVYRLFKKSITIHVFF